MKHKVPYNMVAFIFSAGALVYQCRQEEHGPAPVITGIAPLAGSPGTVITVSGENFIASSLVYFNNSGSVINTVSGNEIKVTVPDDATTGPITVASNGEKDVFPHDFIVTTEPVPSTHTFTVHENGRISSLLLTQSEFDKLNQGKMTAQEYQEVFKDIYTKFNDNFDFIFLIHNNGAKPHNMSYGSTLNISNHVSGIGTEIFDRSKDFGSEGKLKAIFHFPTLNGLRNGPVLHEIMHHWANYAFPTEDFDIAARQSISAGPHWGFSGCGGMLGGFIQSTLQTNVDGDSNKYYLKTSPITTYSNFEMYLMGLIPPQELTPFDVFTDIVSWDPPLLVARTRRRYDRATIEEELGVRSPDNTSSQKQFQALVVVATPVPLTSYEWESMDLQAETLSKNSDDNGPGINFWEATTGLAEIELGGLKSSMKY